MEAGCRFVGDLERLQPGVVDAVPPANVDGGLPGAPWHRGRALPEGMHCGQREGRRDSDDGWTLLELQRQKAEIPEEPALPGAWGQQMVSLYLYRVPVPCPLWTVPRHQFFCSTLICGHCHSAVPGSPCPVVPAQPRGSRWVRAAGGEGGRGQSSSEPLPMTSCPPGW